MRRRSRSIRTAAALGGIASAGLVAQRRAARRVRSRPDPLAAEPFGTLRGTPVAVRADDGTRLHAEIDNADRTDLAVVFSHGWTMTQDCWHFQRQALRGLDVGRLVFWDQRGHGRSDGGDRLGYGVPGLAADLAAVLDQTVPADTPVVLVGHSMGGITIMRYADEHPDEIGRRVLATGLVCTSSGGLGQVSAGLPAAMSRVSQRMMPRMLRAAGASAALIERVRRFGDDGTLVFTDRTAFAPGAAPAAVAFTARMAGECRIEALADFLHSMLTTDVISECATLGAADTLLIGATEDRITPVSHTYKIADCVPSAQLEILPATGHMAMLERPDTVTRHLTDLIRRARKNLS